MSDEKVEWENRELSLKAYEAKWKALIREIGLIIKVDYIEMEFLATCMRRAVDPQPIAIATWAKIPNIVERQVLSEREIARLQRIADSWTTLSRSFRP
jgi:hypothetical protein